MPLGRVCDGAVGPGTYRYFQMRISKAYSVLTLELRVKRGDAALYVSRRARQEDRAGQQPGDRGIELLPSASKHVFRAVPNGSNGHCARLIIRHGDPTLQLRDKVQPTTAFTVDRLQLILEV